MIEEINNENQSKYLHVLQYENAWTKQRSIVFPSALSRTERQNPQTERAQRCCTI